MFGTVLAATVGSQLVGGLMQGDAADTAARAQTQSSEAAIGETRRQYDINRSDLAPYRSSGGAALRVLSQGMGLAMPDGSIASPEMVDGTAFANASSTSPLLRRFSMDDLNNDPVMKSSFNFGLSEGEKAVQRMFGSRGMSRSGAAVKAATRFAGDYTGQQAGAARDRFVQDQTTLYNRLAGVAGTGQTATNTTAQLGTQAASEVGGQIVGAGNARGAAAIAGGNAYGNAATNIGNAVTGQYTLDRILTNGGITGQGIPQVQPMVPGQFNMATYG